MINPFDYIKSDAIREHLKKINYEISAIETATLINYDSDLTLKQKLDLYEKILEEIPDKKYSYINIAGLNIENGTEYQALKYYINYKKEEIKKFFECDDLHMYQCKLVYIYNGGFSENSLDMIFSTYEKCIAYVKKYVENHDVFGKEKNNFVGINIIKTKIDEFRHDYLHLNRKFEIDRVSCSVDSIKDEEMPEEYALEDLPNLPVPFKDGDIVCLHSDEEKLAIIELINDEEGDNKIMNFHEFTYYKNNEVIMLSFDRYDYYNTSEWIEFEYYNGDKTKVQKLIDDVKVFKEKCAKNKEEFY